MKRSGRVPQTHPVEPANSVDSNGTQGDSMVPSHECLHPRDTRLTGANYPDSGMARVMVNHRSDRISFFTSSFEGPYIHQYGHAAGRRPFRGLSFRSYIHPELSESLHRRPEPDASSVDGLLLIYPG